MPRRNEGPRLRFLDKRGVFYICWTKRGRSRERSTGTADGEAAQIALAEFLRTRTRRAGPRDPSEALVMDILMDYMEQRAPKLRAPERIAYAVEPLSSYFAGRNLSELNETIFTIYERWRARSPSTVRRELGILAAAIQHASNSSIITRPVPVKLPEAAAPKERWLTRTEAAMLLAGALGFAPIVVDIETRLPMKWQRVAKPSRHIALFILIGLYTGRRKEAILSLKWPVVDLVRETIDFRRPGKAETKKRRGKCRIPERLLPHLRRARRFDHEVGPVITWHDKGMKDNKTGFYAAARRVHLHDISPHVLRHTAASWLMQAGHDPWKVSDFLSMSLATLLKVYGHHHPDSQSDQR